MTHRLISAPTTLAAGDRISNSAVRALFTSCITYWAPNDLVGGNSARDLIFEGFLQISTAAVSNLTLDLSWQGTQMCSGTFTNLPSGLSNVRLKVDASLRIAITNGAPEGSGLIMGSGLALLDNNGAVISAGMVNNASALGAAGQKSVNTKLAASIGLAAQWSVANAGNIAILDFGRWSELTA